LAVSIKPHENERDPKRPLRIGYVSADFRNHPVARYLMPALWHHGSQVKVTCYSNSQMEDDTTRLMKRCADAWVNISRMKDDEAADRIRADGIDILIDLSGHTAGNRLPVFARKPAPVQVSWLGYFNTTGMDAMDYFISDPVHVTPEMEQWFSEKIVRLPDAYVAYAPPRKIVGAHKSAPMPAVHRVFANVDVTQIEWGLWQRWYDMRNRLMDGVMGILPKMQGKPFPYASAPPALRKGYMTFGSFNHLSKLNDEVIALWAQILKKVPDARLMLKTNALGDDAARAQIVKAFSGYGIAENRLELQGWSQPEELYAQYGEVDIALDPFPFGGGATTCDALWMGVPVITLEGATPVGRQGATYLTQIGHAEWIAKTPEEYAALAAGLAADTQALAGLRAGLRRQMQKSPFCDGRRFAKNLEAAYRQMWKRRCEAE
jgi:predicted O-linked N-acetylglucosamine transferase (SPINDLY family)